MNLDALEPGSLGRRRAGVASVARGVAACLLAAGCAAEGDTVSIYGYLLDGPVLDDEAAVLAGAQVDGYDLEGNLLAEGYEPYGDTPGYYRVPGLPPEQDVVLVASAAGDWVPTVLAGTTRASALYLEDGELYLFSIDDAQAYVRAWQVVDPTGELTQDFDPEVDGNGGLLVGQFADGAAAEGTVVEVETATGDRRAARYFADTGLPDPERAGSAADGRFAVFGLPPGPLRVWITPPGAEDPLSQPFRTLAVEDGITSLLGFRAEGEEGP